MGNSTINPSPDTVAFACLEPRVALLIIDIIHCVFTVLCWRQSSKSLLTEILSRLAEREVFEVRHVDFGESMWPSLPDARRKEKFSRWLQRLKEDQLRSGFQAVWVKPRRAEQDTETGAYKGLPTQYMRGYFWALYRIVQDAASNEGGKGADWFLMSVRGRRARVRAVVAEVLLRATDKGGFGAQPIERETKKEPQKTVEKKPCNCGCEQCRYCLAKGVQPMPEAEALPASLPYTKALDWYCEQLKAHLISLGKVDAGFNAVVAEASKAIRQTERAALDAIRRPAKAGVR